MLNKTKHVRLIYNHKNLVKAKNLLQESRETLHWSNSYNLLVDFSKHLRIWNKTLWFSQNNHDCYETSLPEAKTENHMLPRL